MSGFTIQPNQNKIDTLQKKDNSEKVDKSLALTSSLSSPETKKEEGKVSDSTPSPTSELNPKRSIDETSLTENENYSEIIKILDDLIKKNQLTEFINYISPSGQGDDGVKRNTEFDELKESISTYVKEYIAEDPTSKDVLLAQIVIHTALESNRIQKDEISSLINPSMEATAKAAAA